jgi:hypothetical protein
LRALDGDEIAKMLLDKFGKIFKDVNGQQIYPPIAPSKSMENYIKE